MNNLDFPTNKWLALPVTLTFLFFAGGLWQAGTISLLYCLGWLTYSLATDEEPAPDETRRGASGPGDGRHRAAKESASSALVRSTLC